MRNFAGVKETTKRRISAWVLLAVFVPMVLLSSLHLHESGLTADDGCTECVHHQCGGHLGEQTASFHACVLCQFLTLTMLTIAVAVVLKHDDVRQSCYAMLQYDISTGANGHVVTRGPPAV